MLQFTQMHPNGTLECQEGSPEVCVSLLETPLSKPEKAILRLKKVLLKIEFPKKRSAALPFARQTKWSGPHCAGKFIGIGPQVALLVPMLTVKWARKALRSPKTAPSMEGPLVLLWLFVGCLKLLVFDFLSDVQKKRFGLCQLRHTQNQTPPPSAQPPAPSPDPSSARLGEAEAPREGEGCDILHLGATPSRHPWPGQPGVATWGCNLGAGKKTLLDCPKIQMPPES